MSWKPSDHQEDLIAYVLAAILVIILIMWAAYGNGR